MNISKDQLKLLSKQAQALHPVVTIGNKGLTENVQAEIAVALKAHDLLKIKIMAGEKSERLAMAETICEMHQATLVQSIGYTVTIFRVKPEAAPKQAKKAKHAKRRIKPDYRRKLHASKANSRKR